ncbi:SpoIIE family protein phosphatase [Mycolicibacterium sp. OfavD-34-C]|uniref:SpoIIE family protein phosphatase n=1 Tax=Mycolicibacterium sp. OfavD-34-C TaxID=2917746 RepID=UPI001EF6DBDC|nr:SpoIIE family protein phosphatase [Mycolicibacterium sp. OfavD-34-C]MCG7582470.1 SpoIIE family protein phosphatase [Mycolicibacterium sp. OfavD-34-C]
MRGVSRLARSAFQGPVFVVLCLLAVAVISWFSLVTQPAALATTAWWPAAGVALGLGLRLPRRWVWLLAAAVAAITVPLALWAGRPVLLATGLSVAAGLEMVVGTLILRGRRDELPSLSTPRDIGRLVVAVFASAATFDLLAVAVSLALGDTAGAWTRFVTGAPRHAAGMILLAPLFMSHPRRPRVAQPLEIAAQVVVALAVAVFVFVLNGLLPLAFLPFLPLVWAAMRLTTRMMLVEMLAVALIASVGSASGRGPFSFDRLTPETGSIVLQIFEVSIVIVFLALSLAVGQERDTARRLNISEELFRRNFEASVAGSLIVARDGDGWSVRRSNLSAEGILPALKAGRTRLDDLVGAQASEALSRHADSVADGYREVRVTTDAGRILHFSIVAISTERADSLLALQFRDITEISRARRLEREEIARAAEVQRALLPWSLPTVAGWQAAAKSVPAKQVGGDFYDLRVNGTDAVVTLGDVMGKGMGAGMLAAATRAALQANELDKSAADAVISAARALEGDLQRSSAFVTLAYVHLQLSSGEYRLTDAGHGLHFIIRECGRRVEHVASDDLPIGLGDDWHELRGTLEPGDAVLLVSDGVMDVWGGTVEDLHRAVTEIARRHCGDARALIDALCEGAAKVSDVDDVTALIFGREPVAAGSGGPDHVAAGEPSASS